MDDFIIPSSIVEAGIEIWKKVLKIAQDYGLEIKKKVSVFKKESTIFWTHHRKSKGASTRRKEVSQ